jgi:hypothetical protein
MSGSTIVAWSIIAVIWAVITIMLMLDLTPKPTERHFRRFFIFGVIALWLAFGLIVLWLLIAG